MKSVGNDQMKVRFQSYKRGGIQQIMNYDFEGKENAITAEHLKNGEICKVVGYGQSMTPILKSGQPVICKPVTKDTPLKKNDIVLCKVKGNYYLHKISAIKNCVSYQISNNHGHVNGTINKNNIFGIVVEIL